MKKTIAKLSLWIALKIDKIKQRLELRKMYRITEDIVNLPKQKRMERVTKIRYKFRKNKNRGQFINDWCDEVEKLGKVLDDERSEYGDHLKLKYIKLKKQIIKSAKLKQAKALDKTQ